MCVPSRHSSPLPPVFQARKTTRQYVGWGNHPCGTNKAPFIRLSTSVFRLVYPLRLSASVYLSPAERSFWWVARGKNFKKVMLVDPDEEEEPTVDVG